MAGDILQNYIDGTYTPRTVWERVFLCLKSKGVDVYSPGQHQGKCTTPYVVIKDTGTIGFQGSNKIGSQIIDVIIYCPVSNYSNTEPYRSQIQEFLGALKNYIRSTGNITPIVIDDTVSGYTQTVEYQTFQNLRR